MRRVDKSLSLRSPRRAVRLPCQVVRDRDFRLVADRIDDLSASGALVGPADPVLTGESLWLSFRLPHWGRWIDARARVVRVNHGRRPGERRRALGIEFTAIDEWSWFLLERALVALPPAPPRPRPGRRDASRQIADLVRRSGGVAPRLTPSALC